MKRGKAVIRGWSRIGGMPVLRSRRRTVMTLAVLAVLIAGGVTAAILATSASGGNPKVTANNISRNYRACLVEVQPSAGPQSGSSDAATAWEALQTTASASPVNAQRTMIPASAADNAMPYLNGMVQRRCALIVAVGPRLSAPAINVAKANPGVRVALVDSGLNAPPTPNTVIVTAQSPNCASTTPCPPSDTPSVSDQITALVRAGVS